MIAPSADQMTAGAVAAPSRADENGGAGEVFRRISPKPWIAMFIRLGAACRSPTTMLTSCAGAAADELEREGLPMASAVQLRVNVFEARDRMARQLR